MKTIENVDIKGMNYAGNPLDMPPFTPQFIVNGVCRERGKVTTRPGFEPYGAAGAAAINRLLFFPGTTPRLLRHSGGLGSGKLAYDSDLAGTFSDLSGTFDGPTTSINMIDSGALNGNLYLTAKEGIKKMTAYNVTPALAGIPRGLDGNAALNAGGTMLANNKQVAYRIVWGITDANNNKITGMPSERFLMVNTGGSAKDVDLNFTIPSGITVSHFYQVYRSGQTDTTIEPNDELQLVAEKNPTSGEVSAGTITYTDSTPDSLRNAVIYTSPTQQGILQSNQRPPKAICMCAYKDMMIYGNTTYLQGMSINLISAGSPGLQNNDTMVIAGVTYTAKTAGETIASGFFKLETGLATPSLNIDATSRSLVKVINRYTSNTTVYAYYVSGYNDIPGKIYIEARDTSIAAFVATASRGTAFSPELPTSGTTYTSVSEQFSNGFAVSKNGQPEAVPGLQNRFFVGNKNSTVIHQIVAQRDYAIVITSEGFYSITGDAPNNLVVVPLDFSTTTYPLGGNAGTPMAASLNNQVFCASSQGIVAVSQSGTEIVSAAVDPLLRTIGTTGFAVASEDEREFYLFSGSSNGISVFNYLTRGWSNFRSAAGSGAPFFACGVAMKWSGSSNPATEHVFIAETGATPLVRRMKKNISTNDFAEKTLAVTITSATGTTVSMSSTTGLAAGWTLNQSNLYSVIEQVIDAASVRVRDSGLAWAAGAATGGEPIKSSLTMHPLHNGDPSRFKQWGELTASSLASHFDALTVILYNELTFTTEFSPTTKTLALVPKKMTGISCVRTLVPKGYERSRLLYLTYQHSHAFWPLQLVGLSAMAETVSEKSK